MDCNSTEGVDLDMTKKFFIADFEFHESRKQNLLHRIFSLKQ